MTKVCHFSSAHAPNDTRIFHKQCASLAKAGYEVTFVVKAKEGQLETVQQAKWLWFCRTTHSKHQLLLLGT